MPKDVRRAAERFRTERPGSTTWHSFSFGEHYDPANTSFGPVVAVNDELLEVGEGFDEHEHRDLVIVTYVVSGRLEHRGLAAQVLSAGDVGVFRTGPSSRHAERNAGDEPVRFVQTWLSVPGLAASYELATGPVEVGDWAVSVAEGPRQVVEGHVFVVGTGDTLRISPPGELLQVVGPVLLVERRR